MLHRCKGHTLCDCLQCHAYLSSEKVQDLSKQASKRMSCLFVQVKLNRGLDFPSLDDVLVDMKLAPEVLDLPCPAYFREDRAKVMSKRASLAWMPAEHMAHCYDKDTI